MKRIALATLLLGLLAGYLTGKRVADHWYVAHERIKVVQAYNVSCKFPSGDGYSFLFSTDLKGFVSVTYTLPSGESFDIASISPNQVMFGSLDSNETFGTMWWSNFERQVPTEVKP